MNKKNTALFKKICAIIVSVCFTFTIVSNNLLAAVNADTMQSKKQYFETKDANSLNSMFSSKYGKIVSYNDNSGDTVVINIQDLHCDYFVQKNIAGLIDEISKKYDIDAVYVEGGIGNIDTSLLANINSKYKQNILEMLLKDGKLTGTEYYSASIGKKNLLKGVEDKDLYLKNIDRLGTIIKSKEEISVCLSKVDKEIDFLKSKYLKSKNKKFDKLLKQFENQEIQQEQFCTGNPSVPVPSAVNRTGTIPRQNTLTMRPPVSQTSCHPQDPFLFGLFDNGKEKLVLLSCNQIRGLFRSGDLLPNGYHVGEVMNSSVTLYPPQDAANNKALVLRLQ